MPFININFSKKLIEVEKCNNKTLKILIGFLIDTIGKTNDIIEWINDHKNLNDSPTETYYAEKINKNISIGALAFEGPTITIPKNTFTEIIHEWENLLKTKPQKIIITEENGKYTFDAEY